MRCGLACLLAALPVAAQVDVTTYQYGNSRAGVNTAETVLSPANVNSAQFGKLATYPVDGYLYGQPLNLHGIGIPGKGVRNVVYVATEHDSVYAFDADAPSGAAPLWQVSFIDPAAGTVPVPASDTGCGQIVPEIGITSTPVIDPAHGAIYVVAMTRERAGSGNAYVQRLHALDLTTGAEMPGSPVVIQATYPGTGEGGAQLVFDPKNYKQRPGLLLLNGVVYTAWSSHCDIGVYHGWIIGYDAATLRRVAIYNDTPDGVEGSFWNGGAAPAADAASNMYVASANGTFDAAGGGRDLGESYIRLSTSGGLAVADYFTPYNYAALNAGDVDTGSAGVVLLGDEAGSAQHPHLMAGAGKEGRIYLLDRDNLGKWQSGSDSQIVQSLPGAIGALFGNPAYFANTLYFCGSSDTLKAFHVSAARIGATPASESPTQFGYPGCVPTLSANGTSAGVVWAIDPVGLLRAYDAANVGRELYNSGQNASRDGLGASVKFTAPTVANGRVYAGTQTALVVYGPLSPPLRAANSAGGGSAVAPGSLASAYGSGLAAGTAAATSFPLPSSLAGTTLTVNGAAAPLLYASPGQVNFQLPFTTPAGQANIVVAVNGQTTASTTVQVQSAAPGLFADAAGNAAALNQDGSVNGPGQPASAGSVIAAFVTGLGVIDPAVPAGVQAPDAPLSRVGANVTAMIGGAAAPVQFAGLAPGYAGLYQVNILVPLIPAGDYPLTIAIGSAASNAASVSLH